MREMVLIDTSVWVQHLRKGVPRLQTLLQEGKTLCHPAIVGELACGYLKNRKVILELLQALPKSELVSDEEVLYFIESHRLFGQGIGWIDTHLLASALISNCSLWTLDHTLHRLSQQLHVAFQFL